MFPKFCGLYFHVASNCSWKMSFGEGALTWGSRGRTAFPRLPYPPNTTVRSPPGFQPSPQMEATVKSPSLFPEAPGLQV